MISAGYNTLAGEFGLAWQVVSWFLTVVVELTGLLAGLSLMNQKLRPRRTYTPADTDLAGSSEEEFFHNTGAVEDKRETVESDETEPENGKSLGTWLPHPDDPAPAGASQPPEENR